jgi:tRNA-2-methylthio-N6-dimethylallyladenosine synthase
VKKGWSSVKKYYIRTFGCQMNQHDSEKISGILKSKGYSEAYEPSDADIIIFNTCSIRQKAEQKFYSQLGKSKRLKKRNPEIKIAVAGCIAQHEGIKIIERAPYVDYILGPQNINLISDMIKERTRTTDIAVEDNLNLADIKFQADRKDKLKAFVNIMYGCNNFCSYCVVPYTRGREQSRAAKAIIEEIRDLAESGYKEVTLLGQNVNSYKSELDFHELLTEINKIDGIERIRFITSHPKDISDSLIYAISNLKKVCEHIHLPLQSGSSRMLSLMNRKYTYQDYIQKVEKIRKEIPDIAITSDIIAGFPQETDEDHRLTINALKEVEFDGIFAFKFSARQGTKAASLDGQLEDEIKSARLYEILDVQNEITDRKNRYLEGTVQEILIEGFNEKNSNMITGRTRGNKIFIAPYRQNIKPGTLVFARIIKANRHSLLGDFI